MRMNTQRRLSCVLVLILMLSSAQYLAEQEEQEQQEEEEDGQQYKYAYGEEPETVGARGEGCQSNYGEYMSEYYGIQ